MKRFLDHFSRTKAGRTVFQVALTDISEPREIRLVKFAKINQDFPGTNSSFNVKGKSG